MLELKFCDSAKRYTVEFATVSKNVVSIKGNIPQNTSGFHLTRVGKRDGWDYSDYKTIYKVEKDRILFSNDESVYVQTTNVNVVWNDEDNREGYRPTVLAMEVTKDGKAEAIVIKESENWTKTITNEVQEYKYGLLPCLVDKYVFDVNGTTVVYTHECEPQPEPEPEPTPLDILTERVDMLDATIDTIITDILPLLDE